LVISFWRKSTERLHDQEFWTATSATLTCAAGEWCWRRGRAVLAPGPGGAGAARGWPWLLWGLVVLLVRMVMLGGCAGAKDVRFLVSLTLKWFILSS
jgi:hypothetical protein